jgi:hypothetical protein
LAISRVNDTSEDTQQVFVQSAPTHIKGDASL